MSSFLDRTNLETSPDLTGRNYYKILEQLHQMLCPKSYFEIGVNTGASFALSRCASIGVDPGFVIRDPDIMKNVMMKPFSMFFNMGSDDFFNKFSPSDLFGRPIEMAFLDGMHRCEFLLRDFMNTEAHCRPNSVVVLHDCLPVESSITGRVAGEDRSAVPNRRDWWAGDVWRTALLLKRRRPDLKMTVVDASPTGLVLITGLDPTSTKLRESYADYTAEMFSWSLNEIGVASLFAEMDVQPTSAIERNEQLTARFWL